MYCSQCGTETEEYFKSFHDCGTSLETSGRPRNRSASTHMDLHYQILAWLLIGLAVLSGMLSGVVFLAGSFLQARPFPSPTFDFGPEAQGGSWPPSFPSSGSRLR